MEMKAIRRETLAPYHTRVQRSRPRESVPNMNVCSAKRSSYSSPVKSLWSAGMCGGIERAVISLPVSSSYTDTISL